MVNERRNSAAKKPRFGGGNVKDHGNKPIELDSLLKSSFGRYVQKASFLDFTTGLSLSSLGSE